MSLPVNLSQRELNKFRDSSGVAIAVVNPDGSVVASSGNATVAIGSAATLYAVVNTGASSANVTLNPSPNFIGLVSMASINGRVELVAGTSYIGLATVTVGNLINSVVTQSGNVTVMQGTTPWVVGTSSLPTVTIGNIVAVSQSGTFAVQADTELPVAALLADNTVNPTTPIVGAALMVYDGSTWDLARSSLGDNAGAVGIQQVLPMMFDGSTHDRIRGDSTDGLLVNIGANNDVTVTGNVAVTQSGTWDEVGINDSGNSITVDWTSGATVAVSNLPALPSGSNFIGLVSAASIHGNLDLKSSRTWNISPIALNTSNLSGATIFVASASKKFYITNVIISAASNVGITFISGGTYLTGNASLRMQLAPQSGLIENNNPSAPLYSGLANQTNFLIAQDTAAPLSGRITWYEE